MFLRIARFVPVTGILFAVLVVVAKLLTTGSPGTNASDATWTSYYADSGHRHLAELSFVAIGLAGLCFLQFLGSLRGALARSEGEPARITTAAVASGAAFIAIAIASHAVGTGVPFAVSIYGSHYHVDPNTARLLGALGVTLFVMSLYAAAAMVLAATTLALHAHTFPAWLAWLGVAAAIAGVLSIFATVLSLIVLLWIVAVSAYLLMPRPVESPQAAPMPTG